MQLPNCDTLLLEQDNHNLFITLNRPKVRNAMSLAMASELMDLFSQLLNNNSIRTVILRGSDGNFCSGGDVKDMINARSNAQESSEDPFYLLNREFGRMLTVANEIPQVLVTILEGAILGGGFGLACVSDIAITKDSAQFGLPETSLGIPPAQIAPFVVGRIGLTDTRRLALLGIRFDGKEAKNLGIAHYCVHDDIELEALLQSTLDQIRQCAPQANAITKQIILNVGKVELNELLDTAAKSFSSAIQGSEGIEGTMAFMQKRPPNWADKKGK